MAAITLIATVCHQWNAMWCLLCHTVTVTHHCSDHWVIGDSDSVGLSSKVPCRLTCTGLLAKKQAMCFSTNYIEMQKETEKCFDGMRNEWKEKKRVARWVKQWVKNKSTATCQCQCNCCFIVAFFSLTCDIVSPHSVVSVDDSVTLQCPALTVITEDFHAQLTQSGAAKASLVQLSAPEFSQNAMENKHRIANSGHSLMEIQSESNTSLVAHVFVCVPMQELLRLPVHAIWRRTLPVSVSTIGEKTFRIIRMIFFMTDI